MFKNISRCSYMMDKITKPWSSIAKFWIALVFCANKRSFQKFSGENNYIDYLFLFALLDHPLSVFQVLIIATFPFLNTQQPNASSAPPLWAPFYVQLLEHQRENSRWPSDFFVYPLNHFTDFLQFTMIFSLKIKHKYISFYPTFLS